MENGKENGNHYSGLCWDIRRPWGACWMVAEGGEGENPLPFSLTTPKRGGGWGSPPPKQPFQPTPTPSPGSHQEVCEKIVI